MILRFRSFAALRCLFFAASFLILETARIPAQTAEKERIADIQFEKQVAPILLTQCVACHSGPEPKGGLALLNAKQAMQGGENGPAIVPGDPAASLLWKRIQTDKMPPKHPLNAEQKAILKQWMEEGAKWGEHSLDPLAITSTVRGGRDWWSLQPLRSMTPPNVENTTWVRNGIDSFVLQKLRQSGLEPSPETKPRNLLRRLYFDLIGLPPTPEQLATFEANPSEAAYVNVVEALLASPHYGERWGQHWLDIVRFGESDGFERNMPRENAWHYRDWVIAALNADIPYDEFVRRQLIGDLSPGGFTGAAASGFWVAGVHNTVVGGSERMKQLARQDEIEEVLATVGQTFLGITIHCARCHDHKFDPITQREYYQFASAISGLGFGERNEPVLEEQKKLAEIQQQLAALQGELLALEQAARRNMLATEENEKSAKAVPLTPFALWEFDGDLRDAIGSLHGRAQGEVRFENGALLLNGKSFVETPPLAENIAEKTFEAWVQLDKLDQRGGAAISLETLNGSHFDALVFGEREPKRWEAGSNHFMRSESLGAGEESAAHERPIHFALVYQRDGTITGYREGEIYGHPIRKAALQNYLAQQTEILFGLRHKPAGGNHYLTGKIHRAAFYNRALTSNEIAASAKNKAAYISEQKLLSAMSASQREERGSLKTRIASLLESRESQQTKSSRKIYTLMPVTGVVTRLLRRGDPDLADVTVVPGATAAIPSLAAEFGLPENAPEAERRRKLAEWITHSNNPLFSRVLVNRLWHHHFGIGLVDSPSDFGFNGGRPSHPELLEYLAHEFQKSGYRWKTMHRLIVTSSTYRQASFGNKQQREQAQRLDTENRLLWRGNPRRLDAETVRDAMLSVAGQLNPTVGGPSFKDVSVTFNSGTTFYEPLDVDGAAFFRRTVYRFNPRGGRSALLDTFDCPDSAITAPRRSITTTPLQSLSLLNNVFVLRMANYFADRVKNETKEAATHEVTRAWLLAIGRSPTTEEATLSDSLVKQHGLAALCRALFNLNEFIIVE